MIVKFYLPVYFILIQLIFHPAYAQDVPTTPLVVEQELENLTENNEDVETEDDGWLQEMQHFMKDPINLNNANEGDLDELKILTPLQIHYLISYRNLLGNFINLYELQAIPGWDVLLIRKIKPYVTVAASVAILNSLKSRFKNGESTLLTRVTQVLEKSKGYKLDSSIANNFY